MFEVKSICHAGRRIDLCDSASSTCYGGQNPNQVWDDTMVYNEDKE